MSDKVHNQKVNRLNQKKNKSTKWLNEVRERKNIFKKNYVVSLEAAIY